MSDEITLTIPRERDFLSVAHLVLGGVGVRLNLTYEVLEDLQLALDAILERDRGASGDDDRVARHEHDRGRSRPLARRRAELAREGGEEVGLRRILDTLVDSVLAVETRTEPPAKAAQGGRGGSSVTSVDDRALLRRYHVDGDLSARQQLIEQYMSLVRSLARRYSYRGEQLDDLVQIGAIGLIKAIDRFDIDRGVELTTYATPNIIGEIKRHFRDKGWSVRVPRLAGAERAALQADRDQDRRARPLADELPELAKAAKQRKRCSRRSSRAARTAVSLSTGGGNDEDGRSTRSSRSAPRSPSTRSRRTAPCSRPGSGSWTSASG